MKKKLMSENLVKNSFPNVAFKTVVTDPPWTPELNAGFNHAKSKAYPDKFYPTLSLAEICTLKPLLAKQCHLYIWCVAQHVDWAYALAQSWKANPIILWTWKKTGLGVGRFRCNTEHVLLARIGSRHGNPFGKGGRHQQATAGTCFEWDRGKHSEKPDQFFNLVEQLSPAPRLEMYARKLRSNWYSWGEQLPENL